MVVLIPKIDRGIWPVQLMNALCGYRNYSHHEINAFMHNIFEVSVDWVEKFSELKKQIEEPVHNLIDMTMVKIIKKFI